MLFIKRKNFHGLPVLLSNFNDNPCSIRTQTHPKFVKEPFKILVEINSIAQNEKKMFKDIMYHYKSLKNYIHHKQKDIEIKSFLIDDQGCIAKNSIFTRDAMTVKTT